LVNVSFDDPFYDELAKYPVKFAAPVFYGDSPTSSYSASLKNGTATFLKLKDRFLGVTCHHVLDAYRERRFTLETLFQLGPVGLNPDQYLVSEDKERDLAVIDLTNFVGTGRALSVASFVEPARWPPDQVSTNDVICLAGFPGIWREQVDIAHLRFYTFSSGASAVLSVSEDKIVTTVQIQTCVTEIQHGRVWGSLGGLSGGPVFAWRKSPILTAELVGFIYEYQESLDLMFVRAASVLQETGKIT